MEFETISSSNEQKPIMIIAPGNTVTSKKSEDLSKSVAKKNCDESQTKSVEEKYLAWIDKLQQQLKSKDEEIKNLHSKSQDVFVTVFYKSYYIGENERIKERGRSLPGHKK